MKIGHFCSRIWAPGGIATYVRHITNWQRAAGHEVVFLTGADDADLTDSDGRRAEPVSADAGLLSRAVELQLDVLHLYSEVDAELARSSVPIVRSVLGHAPYCPSGSRFLGRWDRPCNRKFHVLGCTWGHLVDRCGSARPHRIAQDLLRTREEKRTLTGVRVACVSEFVREQMVDEGYDPNFIDVNYLPVQVGLTSARSVPLNAGPPRLVFAGRLVHNKGVAWLLRAFARTTSGGRLDIAGDGDLAPQLKRLAIGLGISERVTFHGWTPAAAVDALLDAAQAATIPSIWHEPSGTFGTEAMARGIAIIGSDVGGIPESVRHEHNGLLVPPNNVPALTAAIDRLLGDPSLAARLGAAGRQDAAERFSVEGHMSHLMRTYAEVIVATRGRRARVG